MRKLVPRDRVTDDEGTLHPKQRSRPGVGTGTASENSLGFEYGDDSPRAALLQGARRDGTWRHNSRGETAKAAAQARDRRPLRELVLEHIEAEASTPEVVYAKLRAAGVKTVLTSVRPRCTELAQMGLVKPSGRHGRGEGGCKAMIWEATSADERSRFAALKALAAEKEVGDE